MMLITIIFLILCTVVKTMALEEGWSGNISYGYYPASDACSGTPLYYGYETAVKAMGDSSFCVTDNEGGIDMYGKWVINCETTQDPLPSAVYEFFFTCNDVDCQDCASIPLASVQIPWETFEGQYPRCMLTNAFNATTSNPREEFATTANFTSLLAPPTSESFGEKGESDIELNKYWQYYYDNSCMGIKNSLTIQFPSAATISRGNVFVQLLIGIVLSLQAIAIIWT